MDNAGRDNCAFDVMLMIMVLIWSMAVVKFEKESDEAGDGWGTSEYGLWWY